MEKVEFSNPELVWVGMVEEEIRLGDLKDQKNLTCVYSLNLTGEDILAINDQIMQSGDWIIVSLQPFTSEEELTVTMDNGEFFSSTRDFGL